MNRSRLTEQSDVASGPDGPITVLSGYVHPTRGPVTCPAAPLVAGWFHERGFASRIGAGGILPAGRGGRLFATTYIDLDGAVVGIAVIAPARQEAVAAEAVRVWSAAVRTRRLIVCASEPACGPTPVVPSQPLNRLAPSAGGAGPAECPRAAATWAAVRQYEARGDTVLVLGGGGFAPAGPAAQQAGAQQAGRVRVADAAGAQALRSVDPERLSFVQHPCSPVEEVAEILGVLRARFPLLRGQHPDQWCYRSSDRRRAVRAVAESSDLVLVSAGSTVAASIRSGTFVAFNGLNALRPEEIAAAATVGVIAPLRAAEGAGDATDAVVGAIGGLGPVSVAYHRTVTEVATDVLARTPRRP
ncbi:hypothetical protein [Kitasatospora sp. NPDC056731]|uniref:hypothetical protein n=1 Tax=Kitasatospora sp. NPDC056731 TaxID=3155422 RepID=UPI003445083C